MRLEELTIPPVFVPIAIGDKIGVHDYTLNENGSFDYADDVYANQTLVAYATDATSFFVRPIVSPIDILDMLQSKRCVCLNPKQGGRSSCSGCYYALPPEMQKALYRRFRAGYEQAFLASLIYLIDNGRTDVDRILAAVPKPKDGPE